MRVLASAIIALTVVVALVTADQAAVNKCQIDYLRGLTGISKDEQCTKLAVYGKCLADAVLDMSDADAGAVMEVYYAAQQSAACVNLQSITRPDLSVDGGNLTISVDEDKDVKFARFRREVVSVYQLYKDVQDLKAKPTMSSSEITSLVSSTVNNEITRSISTAVYLVDTLLTARLLANSNTTNITASFTPPPPPPPAINVSMFATPSDITAAIAQLALNDKLALKANVADLAATRADVAVLQSNVSDSRQIINVHTSTLLVQDSTIRTMQSDAARTRADVGVLQGNVTDLRSIVNSHTLSLSTMDSSIRVLQSDSTKAKADISGLQSSVTDVRNVNAQQNATLLTLDSAVKALNASQNIIRAAFVDVTCTVERYGSIRYNPTTRVMEFCVDVAEGWSPRPTPMTGTSANTPAPTCKLIKERFPSAPTGVYFISSTIENRVYPVLCDMTTRGGGWALVLKVNNGDAKNYYASGMNSPIQTGADINPSEAINMNRIDSQGTPYRLYAGSELMVVDELTKANIYGLFAGTKSLWERIQSGQAGAANLGSLSCLENAITYSVSGGTVAGLTVTGLGLKCEDDLETTWNCDDDASFISWAKINNSHRNGISKCGSDGGDDIYNGENTSSNAFVSVWVR